MTESLFDDIHRADSSPCGYSESTFHFLNRAHGPVWERERGLIDEWWRDYPTTEQVEVRGRVREGGSVGFRSAFFELYLYQVLRRVSTDVECHPAMPNTTRRPDFRAVTDSDGPVIVEAKSGTSSPADLGFSPLLSTVMDAVNDLHFDQWTFRVDAQSEGAQAPRTQTLTRGLTEFVATLDHAALRARIEAGGSYTDDEAPRFVWISDDWRIEFTPIPMRAGQAGPTVGMNAAIAIWNDANPIRRHLRDKGSSYGKIDTAFILALDVPSLFDTDNSAVEVLYGDLAVEFDADIQTQTRTFRRPNGAWFAGDRWRQPQVSGVLMLRNLAPHSVANRVPTLWHHPSPTHRVSTIAPLFRQARSNETEGKIEFVEPLVTPAEFFGLPADWPGPDEAFPRG
jgi:hypothetical protein